VAERSAPPEGERDAAGAEEAALTGGNVGGVQGSGGVGTGDAARAHRLVESVGAGAGVGGGRGPGGRTAFYCRGRALAHFHGDQSGPYADARMGEKWRRLRVSTGRKRGDCLAIRAGDHIETVSGARQRLWLSLS
jgi:hypothetical protein